MDTVHVILWVVIVINIASIVFNTSNRSSSGLTRERFEQGARLAQLITLTSMSKSIKDNPDVLVAMSKTPDFLDEVSSESSKRIKESTERIFK